MTYTSVVSCETVCLELSISALEDLEVKCGDVMNAYKNSPIEENIWTTIGSKFVPDSSKRTLVVHALYGLKVARFAFRAHLGRCMKGLGYEPCLSEPDLWIKDEVRPDDRYEYYSYIL